MHRIVLQCRVLFALQPLAVATATFLLLSLAAAPAAQALDGAEASTGQVSGHATVAAPSSKELPSQTDGSGANPPLTASQLEAASEILDGARAPGASVSGNATTVLPEAGELAGAPSGIGAPQVAGHADN